MKLGPAYGGHGYRKIDGKKYYYDGFSYTKQNAKQKGKELKAKGKNFRIFKGKLFSDPRKTIYRIFVQK